MCTRCRCTHKLNICKVILERFFSGVRACVHVVRDSSAVRRLLFDLLESWDVRALSIRKTADLPLQLLVVTFPRFVAIGFYFLSETLI